MQPYSVEVWLKVLSGKVLWHASAVDLERRTGRGLAFAAIGSRHRLHRWLCHLIYTMWFAMASCRSAPRLVPRTRTSADCLHLWRTLDMHVDALISNALLVHRTTACNVRQHVYEM